MNTEQKIDLIKKHAKELNYQITEGESSFEIFNNFDHAISFKIKKNSSNYL